MHGYSFDLPIIARFMTSFPVKLVAQALRAGGAAVLVRHERVWTADLCVWYV